MDPTTKRVYLTRHAQAEHNVGSDWTIPDAKLTRLGQQQARDLDKLTRDTIQRTAELLVCSPLLRPLETMVLGYPGLKARLEKEGKPVIIMDTLQEAGPYPCDTPTYPPSAIKSALNGIFADLDFSTLSDNYASKSGIFAPERAVERAIGVRKWLRDRPEREIVVVAHGDILRHIVDGEVMTRSWDNAEIKIFTFAGPAREGDDAEMVEIKENIEPGRASDEPTSSEMK